MKQIRSGTLHVSGYENHLYGLCDNCLGVLHLGVLGGEYNLVEYGEIWGLEDKWAELDPADVLKNDDHDVLAEAYHFELIEGEPYVGLLNIPMFGCSCEEQMK